MRPTHCLVPQAPPTYSFLSGHGYAGVHGPGGRDAGITGWAAGSTDPGAGKKELRIRPAVFSWVGTGKGGIPEQLPREVILLRSGEVWQLGA